MYSQHAFENNYSQHECERIFHSMHFINKLLHRLQGTGDAGDKRDLREHPEMRADRDHRVSHCPVLITTACALCMYACVRICVYVCMTRTAHMYAYAQAHTQTHTHNDCLYLAYVVRACVYVCMCV